MDTADYRELVELLQNLLREAGAAELADIRLYASRATDTGELRPFAPKEYVIAMLQAFERYLSIRDKHTFSTAMARINESLPETPVEDATFVPLSEPGSDSSISLGDAPDLSTVRKDLRALINQLQDDDGPPGTTE